MSSAALVTVCIPSYNHADFLQTAVESVLRQEYSNVECLIFDDGSTDESWEIARSLAVGDERVRVLSHGDRGNHGIAATLNAAYRSAHGDYVMHLAADDRVVPDSIERRVRALQLDPSLGFVYGRIEMLDAAGRATGHFGGVAPEAICRHDATDDPLQALLLHCYIPSPTVLLRSELFGRTGDFTDEVYYSDWEFWIRLLAHRVRPGFVDGEPLIRCRPGAYGPEYDQPRRLELFRALASGAAIRGGRFEEPRIRALVCMQHALHAAQLGHENEALHAIGSAFTADPSLRSDHEYLFWWLGPLQRRRLPGHDADGGAEWVRAIGDPRTTPASAVAAGALAGHFACWAIEAAQQRLSAEATATLRWAVIGNELELAGGRLQPRLLLTSVFRVLRRPRLLRERSFVKVLLCSAGVWSLAARIRRAGRATR